LSAVWRGLQSILYGTQLAEHFGIKHHIIKVTLSDLLAALPEVIYYLNPLMHFCAFFNHDYLTSKVAANYVGGIFQEKRGMVFAGYDYKKPPLEEVPQNLRIL
jgi:hypothetical protein